MANIKFSYLYRDAGNYKNFNSVVFANPDNVDIMDIERMIRSKLIENMWFLASEWAMPDLHFDTWNYSFDHDWHEFEAVTCVTEDVDFSISLSDWITICIVNLTIKKDINNSFTSHCILRIT